MDTVQLHPAQASILYTVRRMVSARYRDLLHPTGLDSENFKFHLRKLVKHGYIHKNEEGLYELTSLGKEFANNLDKSVRGMQKQPKLSVIVVAWRDDASNQRRYLFQQRLRHPFWGYWGFIGGPIRWGAIPEATATRELFKQTGLAATFEVKSFVRKIDQDPAGGILEDKQFVILEARDVVGELNNEWSGGHNAWLTLVELEAQDKYFAETAQIVQMVEQSKPYDMFTVRHAPEEY